MRKVKAHVKSSHAREHSLEGGGPVKRGAPAAYECHYTALHLHAFACACCMAVCVHVHCLRFAADLDKSKQATALLLSQPVTV